MFNELLSTINQYAWGAPSIVLLVGTGLFLTIRLNFIQFRYFSKALKILFGKESKKPQPGDISRFQALATALSGTIGTGNIAGVATAIVLGGPGAVFWMWLTALVGMATKFASCTLAVKYREKMPNGTIAGGPMYTLKNGLNMPYIGGFFAFMTIIASFGIGCTVQANSIVDGITYVFPQSQNHTLLIGIVLALAVAIVILGGVKRIASVATLIVPFMALAYCAVAILILLLHLGRIPAAFFTIFELALNPQAAGGAMFGAAIQYGVARGVFSNEAGLGSAAIAHAAARTDDPVKQGLVAMLGPFIDTIVVCTMTALVIIIMAHNAPSEFQGASLSAYAFDQGLRSLGLGPLGGWVVGFGLIFFAYSTIIAWSYYGDRCAQFLLGVRAVIPYRIVFTLLIVVGAVAPLQMVWQFADIANILMAFPNLISVLLLSGLLKASLKK